MNLTPVEEEQKCGNTPDDDAPDFCVRGGGGVTTGLACLRPVPVISAHKTEYRFYAMNLVPKP